MIEINEKILWKSSVALENELLEMYVNMFLKIVTKWLKIQKSKLHNSLTN